jgi:hypothetical protein
MKLSSKGPALQRKETLSSVSQTVVENFRSTEGLLYSLVYVFIVTFVLFPGASEDTYFNFFTKRDIKNSESWFDLLVVFMFNICDTIGRYLGGLKYFDLSVTKVKMMSAMRTVFFATFLLVAFEVPPAWLFNVDWFKVLNIVLFSLSNGYVSTLCAVKAPGTVREN